MKRESVSGVIVESWYNFNGNNMLRLFTNSKKESFSKGERSRIFIAKWEEKAWDRFLFVFITLPHLQTQTRPC